MDKKFTDENAHAASLAMAPNSTRPVWTDSQKTCDGCTYNGQDVDTFPCAKCHTRD